MRLLRTQEAAERLGLHPASVRRLAAQGVIPHFKVGGWRLFDARTIEGLRRERSAKRSEPEGLMVAGAGGDDTARQGSSEGGWQDE
jgi:excisionase family DNA binding protein